MQLKLPKAPEVNLRSLALKALSRREHSRSELGQKLLAKAAESSDVEDLLDELEQNGWLSDQRFVEQVIQARQKRFGSRRIAHELMEKGISTDFLDERLAALRATELERARAIWQRKFGALPKNARERGNQTRFLLQRGFESQIIQQVLRGGATDMDQ